MSKPAWKEVKTFHGTTNYLRDLHGHSLLVVERNREYFGRVTAPDGSLKFVGRYESASVAKSQIARRTK